MQLFIGEAYADTGKIPTRREIMRETGLSEATVKRHVRSLREDGLMPGMATQEEITKLEGLRGKRAEVYYLQLMIRHHKAGVPMAEGTVNGTGLAVAGLDIGGGKAVHGGWNGGSTVVDSVNVGTGPVYIRVR